jgi:hypothetical protein
MTIKDSRARCFILCFSISVLLWALGGTFNTRAQAQTQRKQVVLAAPPGCWAGQYTENTINYLRDIPITSKDPLIHFCIVRLANGTYAVGGNDFHDLRIYPNQFTFSLSSNQRIPYGVKQISANFVCSPSHFEPQLIIDCTIEGLETLNGQPWLQFVLKSTLVRTEESPQHLERCFGGIGQSCSPAGPLSLRKCAQGQIPFMVSVGSILHDNCCLRNPQGRWCQGRENLDFSAACSPEWDKAFFDSIQGRVWSACFGPYTYTNQEDNMAEVIGRNGYPETVSSMKLSAPSGALLDPSDEAFCESKRFAETPYPRNAGGICE